MGKPLPMWRIAQGKSRALVRAVDYRQALWRGARIGFKSPDSVVLIDPEREEETRRQLGAHLGPRPVSFPFA